MMAQTSPPIIQPDDDGCMHLHKLLTKALHGETILVGIKRSIVISLGAGSCDNRMLACTGNYTHVHAHNIARAGFCLSPPMT